LIQTPCIYYTVGLVMSFFLFLLPFYFCFFRVYLQMWVLLLVFLACFQMGSYFVTTAWIFEIG